MNNRDIVNTIGFMVMILIIVIMYFFRYSSNTIPEDIINKNWYKYNYKTGYYEIFNISKKEFKYYRPSNVNELTDYDICKKYSYDKKNNQINLDCEKSIKIVSYNKNKLLLLVDGIENLYFSNYEDSLNYEFESYYGLSVTEYKKEKSQVTDLIKINENKLYEVIKSNEYSKIVFIGDKCTSIDCVLALDVMEKLINKTENIYFYESNLLNYKTLYNLNRINNSLSNNIDFYNEIYPKVIITYNGKVIDKYNINCTGFKCTKYYENEF